MPSKKPVQKKRWYHRYENAVLLKALAGGLPAVIVAHVLIWTWGFTTKTELTLTLFIVMLWLGYTFSMRDQVINTMRILSNLLAALREGDYSLRAKTGSRDDVYYEVAVEINALGETLRQQRMYALEAGALLQKVMDEIEVAVFAFDPDTKLRLANRHAEVLLQQPFMQVRGKTADELGMKECLEGETPRRMEFAFQGFSGRWELRRGIYREGGVPHQLVVLSDLTRTLREEERQAWQRLVQVLRHEINNSLAPIHSLAESLQSLLQREPKPSDWKNDIQQGLEIIGDRSRSLNRFMAAYSQVTRVPKPNRHPLPLHDWLKKIVALETRLTIELFHGPSLTLLADGDQLGQAVINLIRNAVDAALDTNGHVRLTWRQNTKNSPFVEIVIEDDGPGISNPTNLFVPFFTTKPKGTGLGLMISRQIAEAHGGSLSLENRTDSHGCRAVLRLPV